MTLAVVTSASGAEGRRPLLERPGVLLTSRVTA